MLPPRPPDRPGTGQADGTAHGAGAGLEVGGDGVVLSSLRRRDGWLELRLACQHPVPVTATVRGGLVAAREADLLGRPGPTCRSPTAPSGSTLRAWEIRTVQLQREGP